MPTPGLGSGSDTSVRRHLPYVLALCALVTVIWLLPVLVSGGRSPEAPTLLLSKNYAETGMFSLTDDKGRNLGPVQLASSGITTTMDGRLSAVFFAALGPTIGWTNWFGWAVVSALLMAGSLFFFWLFVCRLLDARTAWISSTVLAFMPMTWRLAVTLTNYQTAFLFLFAALAAYVWLCDRRPVTAILAAGFLFGLSIASKDVFLTFLPWTVGFFLWEGRKRWKRSVGGVALFLFVSLFVYALPYVGDISREGYPLNQNLARLWPVKTPAMESVRDGNYLHLYPDPYTYFVDKEAFDREYLASMEKVTWLERFQEWKLRVNFGLEAGGVVGFIGSGFWILLNNIPSFFQQALIGSVVLWLFIVPGVTHLRKRRSHLVIAFGGLIIVTYLMINVVLQYSREHLMDFGWILAIVAAVGIGVVADILGKAWKIRGTTVAAVIVAVLALQMLQANRFEFARIYAREPLPAIDTRADALLALPPAAVVAVPWGLVDIEALVLAGERSMVRFSPGTVEALIKKEGLRKAFDLYGITHILGYEPELTRAILQDTSARAVTVATEQKRSVSPFLNYLLTIFR